MMIRFLALVVLLVAATPRGWALFGDHWGNVIVVTTLADAGKDLTAPAPDKPVYYEGLCLGNRLGSIPGDTEPKAEEMNRFVAQVLAKQGYLGARKGVNEPTLFLVLQWGYLKPGGGEDLLWFLGYDPSKDVAAPTPAAFGVHALRRSFRNPAIAAVVENADSPIYGILITAFEHATAHGDHPVALWQTRIGLPAVGKSMSQAMPAMILAAEGAIGRESDFPIQIDTDNARKATVKIKDFQVLDTFLDGTNPSPAPSGTQK